MPGAWPGAWIVIITIPLMLFGMFRYCYVVKTCRGAEAPTGASLTDGPLIAGIVNWIGICLHRLMPRGTFPS